MMMVHPTAKAGPHFQASISRGIVPGDDLAHHANGFLAGHRGEASSGNGVAKELVRPAGIILQGQHRVGHIEKGLGVGFAIVLGLQAGQECLVTIHQSTESAGD